MADHADLREFPVTPEGRESVANAGKNAQANACVLPRERRRKVAFAAELGSETEKSSLLGAFAQAICGVVHEALNETRPERLPRRISEWSEPSADTACERWIPYDSGAFVRADNSDSDFVRRDGRQAVDPLAETRKESRTVVHRGADHEVAEYCDGWGNRRKEVEYFVGVVPPKPIWQEPKEQPPRPVVPRAALGKIANNVSKSRKNETWLLACRARPWQRPRTQKCRVHRIGHQSVQVRSDGVAVSLCGVETCASVWGCPVCAQAIYTERAEELKTATKAWRARGPTYVVLMVTTTVRHQRCDDLKWLRKGVANSWRAMWQGRRAKLLKAELGIVHSVRALEATEGSNGWHPHLHTLFFVKLRTPPASDEVWDEEQISSLRNRWIDAVEKVLGVGALPNWENGLNVRVSHKDDYIAKLGLEIASIAGKQGRLRGHRTPWQLLRAATNGEVPAQWKWTHYTEAMCGARQLTWSLGAKKAFGIAEKTDQEIAEAKEEQQNKPCVAFNISGWLWDSLIKVPGWLPAFIQAVREEPSRAASMLPPTSTDHDKRSWYQFDRGG